MKSLRALNVKLKLDFFSSLELKTHSADRKSDSCEDHKANEIIELVGDYEIEAECSQCHVTKSRGNDEDGLGVLGHASC